MTPARARTLYKLAYISREDVRERTRLYPNLDKLLKNLQRGDIILTKDTEKRLGALPFLKRLWKGISKGRNAGVDWSHAAFYRGDGQISHLYENVEDGEVGGKRRLRKMPLSALASIPQEFLVLRPQTNKKLVDLAMKRLKKLKQPEYSTWDLLLTGLGGRPPSKDERSKIPDKMVCSALLGYLYPDLELRPGKGFKYVRPADIFRHPKLKTVGAFGSENQSEWIEPQE